MRILVASDKFKGSLTAAEACDAIADGLRSGAPGHEVECVPIADGGDGLSRILTDGLGGEWIEAEVTDPLGDRIVAGYGLVDDGKKAIIEMAEASGIALLAGKELDPWRASTFGTGELIADAMNRGVEKIILGIGGSATNDGGTGMAEALGVEISESWDSVKFPENWNPPKTTVACDVENLLLGPDGCTRVYGPQKGIAEADFAVHEERLARLVRATGSAGDRASTTPGSGAAGGLGFGCMVFLDAELVGGFDLVAEHLGLTEKVAAADLVITGEGKIDRQSLAGKGPAEIARMAERFGKRRAAFCGIAEGSEVESLFGPIFEIRDPNLDVEENMARGAEFLRRAAEKSASQLLF